MLNRKVAREDGSVSWYMERTMANGRNYRYCLHLSARDCKDRMNVVVRIKAARRSLKDSVARENARLKRLAA